MMFFLSGFWHDRGKTVVLWWMLFEIVNSLTMDIIPKIQTAVVVHGKGRWVLRAKEESQEINQIPKENLLKILFRGL